MNNYHTKVSMWKSFVRIVGYTFLVVDIGIAMWILIVSELLGIIEEIKWK